MTACAEHRGFLVAIADGQTAGVPAATQEHVGDCPDCGGEIELHRAAAARLRQALEGPASAPSRGRRRYRTGLAALGTVAAVVIAAAGLLAFNLSGPDPVLAAAQMSQQPAQFTSSDGKQIGAWCVKASGRPMPEMDLSPLQPVGARMDHQAGTGIITVYYVSPEGQPLTVSWLNASTAPVAGRSVSSRVVGGRLILVANSAHGTAVIAGAVPPSLLWTTAATVEDGS